MITVHPKASGLGPRAVWIDLLDPTEAERSEVERATGLRAPTRAALSEIESSSRLRTEDGVLYLSTPFLALGDGCLAALTPVGLVLTPAALLTVRFEELPAFRAVSTSCEVAAHLTAEEVFLRILEVVVDQSADRLEEAAASLEAISHATFRAERSGWGRRLNSNKLQRAALRSVGEMGERVSKIRDSLLGLGRIAGFVAETADARFVPDGHGRLAAVRADLASLNDYQGHLLGKVQFLLDATLGFINIEQNDIVKALTIASVVGVPPVLVAGIYGMNFKFMPEYGWSLGYPYALGLMLVTGLLPLAWFKWRGWM
jgi:magnesium transporter